MSKIISSVQDWKKVLNCLKDEKSSIGFVPTMGALHRGHLSLIERSAKENVVTVVSIYVNPTQFNNKKDLDCYPRTLDEDVKLAVSAGADYIFAPHYDELYRDGYRYKVSEESESKILCGAHRSGHFDGVLSVVIKLLNIIGANSAYFGKKDFQQLKLIQGMVNAFFMDVVIVPCEIERDEDGLALSSRNRLLSTEARKLAPSLNRALKQIESCSEVAEELEESGFTVDYIEEHFGRRFGAAFLDNVRLIDNVEI